MKSFTLWRGPGLKFFDSKMQKRVCEGGGWGVDPCMNIRAITVVLSPSVAPRTDSIFALSTLLHSTSEERATVLGKAKSKGKTIRTYSKHLAQAGSKPAMRKGIILLLVSILAHLTKISLNSWRTRCWIVGSLWKNLLCSDKYILFVTRTHARTHVHKHAHARTRTHMHSRTHTHVRGHVCTQNQIGHTNKMSSVSSNSSPVRRVDRY